ncbi:MAG: hypothetical protein NVSMB2_23430 [Chloroflexota bacterium]
MVATLVAMVLQDVTRETWQVRTLPERVMEWLLRFLPLDLFERALGALGSDAKGLALAVTWLGMFAVLVAIGAATARTWRTPAVLALGPGLWLMTMALIMPLMGAGLFGTGLLLSPIVTGASFLLVFLAYATVLELMRWVLQREVHRPRLSDVRAERRALLVGLFGCIGSGAVARAFARNGSQTVSTLPMAQAPSVRAASLGSPVVAAPPSLAGPPVPTPAAAPTPAPVSALPVPAPSRTIARGKDGVLTAAGRMPGQLAPLITDSTDFYVVSKNAVADPVVDVGPWRLVVDGDVARPVQIDYATLRALPSVDVTKTLECISNLTAACELTRFGCDLISTARWRGARLSDVVALAGGLTSSATDLTCVSADEFSASLPASIVDDPHVLVVYEMNGLPLAREHGFPVRLLVPGRYGMKNPKWLIRIQAIAQHQPDWYEQRNWNKDGVVQTMSRIDTPADGATLTPGQHVIAGVAYAGDRGVLAVHVSVDDGSTWHPTDLIEPMAGRDTIVRWKTMLEFGPHSPVTLVVRAVDGSGEVQSDAFRLPQPDGGTGRHAITVSIV